MICPVQPVYRTAKKPEHIPLYSAHDVPPHAPVAGTQAAEVGVAGSVFAWVQYLHTEKFNFNRVNSDQFTSVQFIDRATTARRSFYDDSE